MDGSSAIYASLSLTRPGRVVSCRVVCLKARRANANAQTGDGVFWRFISGSNTAITAIASCNRVVVFVSFPCDTSGLARTQRRACRGPRVASCFELVLLSRAGAVGVARPSATHTLLSVKTSNSYASELHPLPGNLEVAKRVCAQSSRYRMRGIEPVTPGPGICPSPNMTARRYEDPYREPYTSHPLLGFSGPHVWPHTE